MEVPVGVNPYYDRTECGEIATAEESLNSSIETIDSRLERWTEHREEPRSTST